MGLIYSLLLEIVATEIYLGGYEGSGLTALSEIRSVGYINSKLNTAY
jgi:hypothetical protein